MEYDPEIREHRRLLAEKIIKKLNDSGFEEEDSVGERTFARYIGDGMFVRVYTSIVDQEVRSVGKDAVRVCGLHTSSKGSTKKLAKEKRVNRTGKIDDIVDRMYQRMRDAWKVSRDRPRCKRCGAPTFVSKKKKDVCTEICWE